MKEAGIGYGSVNHSGGPRPGLRLYRRDRRRMPALRPGMRGEGVPVEKLDELRKRYPGVPHFAGKT